MLDKLLNDFKEKMVAEDISDNTIKNYVSDIKNFYKWYREIDFSENIEKVTHYHLNAYKDYLIHNQRSRVESWRADSIDLLNVTTNSVVANSASLLVTFPASASSNAACRFPALRFPNGFSLGLCDLLFWLGFRFNSTDYPIIFIQF